MKRIVPILFLAAFFIKTTSSFAQTNTTDSLALVDLYDSCGGTGWTHTWNLASPVTTWYGVTVVLKRVAGVVMDNNKLKGILPASVGNITDLVGISLDSNQLSGRIPTTIGNLTKLTGIGLAQNQLSGSIPSAFGNLTLLGILNLNNNLLTDSIPSSIGGLKNLVTLALGDNLLSGSIPSALGNLTALTGFYLLGNELTGSIPVTLGNLSKLQYFDIDDNNLTDTIPASLGNLTAAKEMALDSNQLTGSVPSSFGNLVNLNYLFMGRNELSGTIPASLATLPALDSINLEANQFTFAGMEAIASAYPFAIYAPQAEISITNNGSSLSVSAGGTLANDTFHWFRNNILYQTIVGDSVLPLTETGNYFVAVTNKIVTNPAVLDKYLILFSDTVDVASLPVSLISFAATKQGNHNLLQWKTANEINSNYFAVERSTDNVNFTSLGNVNAKGNTASATEYSFTDNKPNSGTNYYRLRIVNKDETYVYSGIRTINDAIAFAANIYPNPVQSNLTLNFTSGESMNAHIEIINEEGKTMFSTQTQISEGASTQNINTASLTAGLYYIRLITAQGESELKFVKGN
jgi:hypothetical protein